MSVDRTADASASKVGSAPQDTQPKIRWDDTNMRSSYANVCNATSTREEVILLFGINQAWHSTQKELTVQLSDRIILSPFAAKRLVTLLANIVREHEARFGPLDTATKPSNEGAVKAAT